MENEFDIVIVGGGIVGCALALALAKKSPYRLALIEAGTGVPIVDRDRFDARVVALSNTSQGLLQDLDVWSTIVGQRYCAYREMHVWDGDGTASIHFDCHDIRQRQLGFIVENNIVIQALLSAIEQQPNVDYMTGARVANIDFLTDESTCQQTVKIDTGGQIQAVRCKLILAADGGHSSVRDLAGLATRAWDYAQSAIVTTVETSLPHQYTAWQRFTTNGPIALLPLAAEMGPESRKCSLVWTAKTQMAARLIEEHDEDFMRSLGRATEYKLGKIEGLDRRYCLPLRQRFATTYIRPGLALVGDAAHTLHPLAGQGVNLGLYDVIALKQEIIRAARRNLNPGDFSVLQRYERARQTHNMLAMATMEGFKRLFAAQMPALRWLRNFGMQQFDQHAWLKKILMDAANS